MLEQLKPRDVFRWFEHISAIPRGSGHMEAISQWCMDFAQQRGLSCRQDSAGNVVITKPGQGAAAGCAPLILQGHMDMVCAATGGGRPDLLRAAAANRRRFCVGPRDYAGCR